MITLPRFVKLPTKDDALKNVEGLAQTVDSILRFLTSLPRSEIRTVETESLDLPMTLLVQTRSPVFVSVNARLLDDAANPVAVTGHHWHVAETEVRGTQVEITTLTGLTLGTAYRLDFLIVGGSDG